MNGVINRNLFHCINIHTGREREHELYVIVTKLKIRSCAGLNDSRFLNGTLVRNQAYTDQGSATLPEGIKALLFVGGTTS